MNGWRDQGLWIKDQRGRSKLLVYGHCGVVGLEQIPALWHYTLW